MSEGLSWKLRMQQCEYCQSPIVWNELGGQWICAVGDAQWAAVCSARPHVDGGVGHQMDEDVARTLDRWGEDARQGRNSMR